MDEVDKEVDAQRDAQAREREDYGATFDAARTEFGQLAPLLWNPLGERLVAATAPVAGERVLDACCGTGASALPAARRVGPTGAVDAVDLSDGLLGVARGIAGSDLPWLTLTCSDVTTWTGSAPYDVVQSGYGVFFLPDMDADAGRLAGLLRPGGRFGVLAWHKDAMDAFARCLLGAVELVRGERPPPARARAAANRIETPDAMAAWLTAIGLTPTHTARVDLLVPLDETVSWKLVLGTGFRAMLDGMAADDVERLRTALLDNLAAAGVDHFDARSVVGVGVR